APYLARLVRAIELVRRHLSRAQVVEQLHFGGGTPTFLSPGQLRELMSQLRTHLNLLDDDSGDYGIEIDPREADWSTMGLLRELGFNRVSLGVQDFDMEVQKAVNRMQTPEETRTIVEAARTLQYRWLNRERSYGLPRQTPASFARTVAGVLALPPGRGSGCDCAR
ncbi:radical SAM protein, partial [Pseudomonas aeruginosa]